MEKFELAPSCDVLCNCKLFGIDLYCHEGYFDYFFWNNENIPLRNHLPVAVEGLRLRINLEWSRSGGDDRLSAEDARDKAKSAIEEIIAIAKQVKDLLLYVIVQSHVFAD